MTLTDNLGRRINYLRLSVTDRCNMRCRYCMPASGIDKMQHGDIGLCAHRGERQRHVDQHPAEAWHHPGRKHRRMGKPCMPLHLGQMLVPHRKAIGAEGDVAFGLETLDQRLSAARISGDGIDRVGPAGG